MPDDDFQLPDAFTRDLKHQIAPGVDVPRSIDDAILRGARAHLARRRSWRAWLATAAAIGLAGSVALVVLFDRSTPPQSAIQINAEPVKILDALTLARHGGASADVDRIAMLAVKLEER